MSQDMEIKREREKRMVSQMILLYCRKNHNTPGGLCPQCRKLDDYARARSEHCPFMETKTFCSNCRVHCYRSEMRMIFYHPAAAIRHVIETQKERRRLAAEG